MPALTADDLAMARALGGAMVEAQMPVTARSCWPPKATVTSTNKAAGLTCIAELDVLFT